MPETCTIMLYIINDQHVCTLILDFVKNCSRVLAHDQKGISSSSYICTTITSQNLCVKRPHTVSQNASPFLIEILSVPLCNTSTLSVLV